MPLSPPVMMAARPASFPAAPVRGFAVISLAL